MSGSDVALQQECRLLKDWQEFRLEWVWLWDWVIQRSMGKEKVSSILAFPNGKRVVLLICHIAQEWGFGPCTAVVSIDCNQQNKLMAYSRLTSKPWKKFTNPIWLCQFNSQSPAKNWTPGVLSWDDASGVNTMPRLLMACWRRAETLFDTP